MQLNKTVLNYSDTNYFSKLILDYLSGEEKLKSFYSFTPQIDSFREVIDNKAKQLINRDLLVEVIEKQYKESNCELPTANCKLLQSENTFTVTTGHQLCLFTGPLYFIYKIITTINLAEELKKKYPENNFVPIYWMASEDHDFAEINHIHLFGKKIEWKPENQKAIAVGKLNTESIQQVIEELKPILGASENALQLIALFEKSYLQNKNLADATRCLVHELFKEYGLVILDADNADLKREFASVLEDDIFNHSNYNHVNNSIKQLETLGAKAQVNPREINCFYMTNELRERIVFENGKYVVNNTSITFSKEELQAELKNHPERFSPNVVLRPLYQETILPNLAYIGGGGELAYWLEYKAMFDFHKIQFPVLILRNSVLFIDAASQEKWNKFELTQHDLFSSTEEIIKKFIASHTNENDNLKEEQEKLKAIYELISAKAQKKDATLKASADGELQKALSGIANLENKMLKAEKQKQETSLNQIKKIKDKLFPEGELQERYDTVSTFYLKYGNDFIKSLKENLSPWENKFTLLTELK